MLQLNTLSSRQEAYLHNLADQYAQLLPEAMAVHSLILMYDMLEALEFTHEQIESVFGPQVMLYLTGLLYGAHCAAEDIPSPLAAVPLLTINGRPVPFLGTVDPDGRIHYGLAAQTLLNGTNPPA
ncbi:MAG: hypothetical protein U0X20_28270 [Caldilineaceae bacterium]